MSDLVGNHIVGFPTRWLISFIVNQLGAYFVMIWVTSDLLCKTSYYENMPMQYNEIFKIVKNENFHWKNFDIFHIFAQNIDCGYTLEPPR